MERQVRVSLTAVRDALKRYAADDDIETLVAVGEEFITLPPPTKSEVWRWYANLLRYPFWSQEDVPGMRKTLQQAEIRYGQYLDSKDADSRIENIRAEALRQFTYEVEMLGTRESYLANPTEQNLEHLREKAKRLAPSPVAIKCAYKNTLTQKFTNPLQERITQEELKAHIAA